MPSLSLTRYQVNQSAAMVIRCADITNMGSKPVVVTYGSLPNSEGPSGNGYSVISPGNTVKTDWTMGQTLASALTVHSSYSRSQKTTWKICNSNWEVHVYAAEGTDGAEEDIPLDSFTEVSSVKVVVGVQSFSLYVGNYQAIGITNDTSALQMPGGTPAMCFVFKVGLPQYMQLTATDSPATLLLID